MFQNPKIKEEVFHYWDYISNNLSDLDTVKFINFQHKKSANATNFEKGIRWLILSLYKIDDLEKVLL